MGPFRFATKGFALPALSVLVAACSETTIPVSCVEQGRWHARGASFGGIESAEARSAQAEAQSRSSFAGTLGPLKLIAAARRPRT